MGRPRARERKNYMLLTLQLIPMAVMFALTYLAYQTFGPPRLKLVYTEAEKAAWDDLVKQPLGTWFTITNVLGTLTSIATAYLFFIGSSKLFGWWSLLCCVTIWLGALVTNGLTRRIIRLPRVAARLGTPDLTGSILASVFWDDTVPARATASLIRWISLFNIGALIWLDFSLFARISTIILGLNSRWAASGILVVTCLVIFHFTIRYGLRGFVFADLFQSPALAISTAVLFLGCLYVAAKAGLGFSLSQTITLMTPVLPATACVFFALHVTFLNLIQVAVTEPHWLRMWAFREKETQFQVVSLLATAALWLVLVSIGFLAYRLTGGKVGEAAIAQLLKVMLGYSPVFVVAFWCAGIAALFASADTLIYSFLLVYDFNPSNGKLRSEIVAKLHPSLTASVAAAFFLIVYFVIDYWGLPFAKIMFVLIPFCLNAFPAFALEAFDREPRPALTVVSLILYMACAANGFLKPESELLWTLAASFVPVAVAFIGVAFGKRRGTWTAANV